MIVAGDDFGVVVVLTDDCADITTCAANCVVDKAIINRAVVSTDYAARYAARCVDFDIGIEQIDVLNRAASIVSVAKIAE